MGVYRLRLTAKEEQSRYPIFEKTLEVIRRVEKEQLPNIEKAGSLMADAIANVLNLRYHSISL